MLRAVALIQKFRLAVAIFIGTVYLVSWTHLIPVMCRFISVEVEKAVGMQANFDHGRKIKNF